MCSCGLLYIDNVIVVSVNTTFMGTGSSGAVGSIQRCVADPFDILCFHVSVMFMSF